MSSAIIECRKVEEEGKELIEKAKKEAEATVAKADVDGRKILEKVEKEVQLEVEKIFDVTAKKISRMKTGKKKIIEEEIAVLDKIKKKKIEDAVDLIIKNII